MTQEEPVLFAEFSSRVGSPDLAISLLDAAGVRLGQDPLGRLMVPADAVRRILELREREDHRRLELAAEHRAWIQNRAVRRQQAVHIAYEAALDQAMGRQLDTGRKIRSGEIKSEWAQGAYPISPTPDLETLAKARHAGTEAAAKFDEREPEIDFWTWVDKGHRDRKGRLK